ncbi:MAG TPA: type II toxin-antitoxin system RelE/ParE family toxin [Thermoanaerobaculia bacterium]|nr:type II toxin-antitoxin system RelE/ParE family toxin [Thermoanaerobaculia bacterium]
MGVTFNELAERELNDAAQYYEHEQAGLGAAFIAEIERCTRAVVEHPQAGPVVLGSIRRRLCSRFPYALLYTVARNDIRILAVMNLKRRPGYWVGRT